MKLKGRLNSTVWVTDSQCNVLFFAQENRDFMNDTFKYLNLFPFLMLLALV